MNHFNPKIVGFLCHWCSYEGADSAGRAGRIYPANIRIIRMMCTGRMDPEFILKAFFEGADGVLILGCHPGNCHHRLGNYQAQKRYILLKRLLKQLGIEEERLRLDWISANEGEKFVKVVTEMVRNVIKIGPYNQ